MRQWKQWAGMAAAGALCCGVAIAQPPEARPGGPGGGRGPERMFSEADTNKDGSLSFEEAQARMKGMTQERFDRWDKDGSGTLSIAELPKRGPEGRGGDERGPRGPEGRGPDGRGPEGRGPDERGPHGPGMHGPDGRGPGGPGGPEGRGPGEMLRRADTDKDGKVTLDEFKAAVLADAERRFHEFDRNNDGVLSPEDRPEGGPQSDMRGPGGKEGRGPGRGPDGRNWEDARKGLIESADADGDGRVTYQELEASKPGIPRDAFDRMDGDHDGAITMDDPAPAGPPHRGPGGPGRPDGPPPAE